MPADIERCVAALKGKPGVRNAYALCQWMKAEGKGLFAVETISDVALSALVKEYNLAEAQAIAGAGLARTKIQSNGDISIYAPIVRTNPEERMVWGYGVTTTEPESGRKPIALSAMEAALPAYMKFANVREMHKLSAVGKAKEATLDEKGIYLGVKVTDDAAWKKVVDEVYQGFSVGGKILDETDAEITAMKMTEFSLVDRPDVPDSIFEMYRSADKHLKGANTVKEEIKRAFDSVKDAVKKYRDVAGEKLERSMWNVSELVRMLENLHFMRKAVKYDAEVAGDAATEMPGMMDELVKFFSAVATAMMNEEVAKLNPESESPDTGKEEVAVPAAEAALSATKQAELQRKGARFAKGTLGRLREVHRVISALLGLPAMNDADMDAKVAEVAEAEKKAADDQAAADKENENEDKENEEKEKEKEAAAGAVQASAEIADLKRANAELLTRLEAVEKRAMPPKTTRTDAGGAISKEDDGENKGSDVQRAVNEAAAKGDTHALMLGIHKGYKPEKKK